VSDVRERLEDLHAERARARARFHAGIDGSVGLDAVYERFEDLAAGEPLDAARHEYDQTRLEASREAARRILRSLEAVSVEARVRDLEQELATRERAQTLRLGSEEITAFEARVRAARETDTEQREELDRGLDRCDEDLAPLRTERRAGLCDALERSGHATPLAWAQALRPDVDLPAWARSAGGFLERSASAWRDALDHGCRAAKVARAPLRSCGLAHVLALPRWHRYLPHGQVGAAVDRITEAWGVRLADLPGLSLDVQARPYKNPAPRADFVRVPGETRLCLHRRGSADDYLAVFDLGGRALARSFTSQALPLERRRLGDHALELAWGALLQDRLFDPAWAEDGPVAARAQAWLEDARVVRLARLRWCAARVVGELELAQLDASGDVSRLEDAHVERVREALEIESSPAAQLRDLSALPRAIDELRASCLAAQLAEHLRVVHGRDFWRRRACGELLKELWNTGTTYTAEGLASQLGLGELDVDHLLA
jgi:hypothetical protein